MYQKFYWNHPGGEWVNLSGVILKIIFFIEVGDYTNPGYGLSLVDTLWNAGSYRQPLEQEGNPMT